LVVKAGAAAPRRRKDQVSGTDTAGIPLDGLEAHLLNQLQDNKDNNFQPLP
jgi:hypothetical protein